MISYSEDDSTAILSLKIVPRSSVTELVGEYGGALKIKINAPAFNGAANRELLNFLSKSLGTAKSDIEIIGGMTSRTKLVRIRNAEKSLLDEFVGSAA